MKSRKRYLSSGKIILLTGFFVSVLLCVLNIEIHKNILEVKRVESIKDQVSRDIFRLNFGIKNNEVFSAIKILARESRLIQDTSRRLLPDFNEATVTRLVSGARDFNLDSLYIMSADGKIIASTIPPNPQISNDFSFRYYYKQAMKGYSVVYPAVLFTNGERSLIFAVPIYDPSGSGEDKVTGVLAASLNAEVLDRFIEQYDSPVMIVSGSGIIFSTNRDELLFKDTGINSDRTAPGAASLSQFGTVFEDNAPDPISINLNSDIVSYKGAGYIPLKETIQVDDEFGRWEFIYLLENRKWYHFLQPWLFNILILLAFTVNAILVIFRSRTRALKKEKKRIAEENEYMLTVIFDKIQTGILLLDPDSFGIIKTNKVASDIFDINQEDLPGMTYYDLLNEGRVTKDFIIKGTGDYEDLESIILHSDRQNLTVRRSAVRIKLMDKNYILESIVDITKSKQDQILLEESKIAAEAANRAKSEFLANMSHEIRTPLNAIIGFTRLMIDSEVDDSVLGHLKIVKNAGENLLALINDILDFSKIEAGKLDINKENFKPSALADHVYSIFAAQAETKELFLETTVSENVPAVVCGDQYRIMQIMINLMGNAFKFTSHGGVKVFYDYDSGNELLVIDVTDTGIGINNSKIEHIFSTFAQAESSTDRKFGGTGLGLSISRKLAELMGGSLEVVSTEGKGSVFTLLIPAPAGFEDKTLDFIEEKNQAVLHEVSSDKKAAFRILLAEDNKVNRMLVTAILDDMGLSVEYAEDGMEALKMLEEADYDLLLLDMQMPVLDGMGTIAAVRKVEKTKNLYVIALTANAMSGDKEKYIRAGCNDYLAKPIDKTLFTDKICSRLSDL